MPISLSEAVAVLKKGTEVVFAHPEQAINQQGVLKGGYVALAGNEQEPKRYLYAGPKQIERKRIVDPILSQSNEIQIPKEEITVRSGEVIGWPGYDGNSNHKTTHLELFTRPAALKTEAGFWSNRQGDGPRDAVYGVKQGSGFHKQIFPNRIKKVIPEGTVLQLAEPVSKAGKYPMAEYRHVRSLKTVAGWVRGSELGSPKALKPGDRLDLSTTIDRVWSAKPNATSTEATRITYVGLKPSYRGKKVSVTILDLSLESLSHWFVYLKYTVPDSDYVELKIR
jgi:hypothetical protein